MKFCTFVAEGRSPKLGVLINDMIVDLNEADPRIPRTMIEFLQDAESFLDLAKVCLEKPTEGFPMASVKLLPPLPKPESFRDFMGFAEHVETSRRNRGQAVDPVYYEIPVFYFSNTNNFLGPFEKVVSPRKTQKLDFEFEVGIVLSKTGRDISHDEADKFIFGYTILNDWSARDFQLEEMKVGLGPAKGKDFATSMGPFLVTKDEFEPYRTGSRFDRKTRLTLNGTVLRENNLLNIHHDFASMIVRASEDVTLYPGELIGSGTIGGGCLLEYQQNGLPFLKSGDALRMEIEGLGCLESSVL